MFNIITLIIIVAATLSPQGLKPAHLQEYDLVGEMPEVLITAQKLTQSEMNSFGLMPEIVVTAPSANTKRNEENIGMMPTIEVTAPRYINVQGFKPEYGLMPEVVITAPRYNQDRDLKPYYGMMPEVIITAERYPKRGTLFALGQNNESESSSDQSQSSFNDFSRYAPYIPIGLILVIGLIVFLSTEWRLAFLPIVIRHHPKRKNS